MKWTLMYLTLFASISIAAVQAQTPKYPPIEQYLTPQVDEIALAKSAAPTNISDRATIKVLTKSGFEVVQQGDNGSVCMVMRGFSAPTYSPSQFRDLVYDPTVLAPICFTPAAAKTAMPYYELRTKLALQAKSPDQIAAGVEAAYTKGELPKRDEVSFAYMWSVKQNLASGVGHWHPHMMVFAPYYNNSMLGEARKAGAPVTLELWEGMHHVFQLDVKTLVSSWRALDRAAAFLGNGR